MARAKMNFPTIDDLELNENERKLLRLAGFELLSEIEQWEISPFISKIQEANNIHKVYQKAPSSAKIRRWWQMVCEAEEQDNKDTKSDDATQVNFENDPDVLEMIKNSPLAMPLKAAVLAEKNVPVSAIPVAILLTQAKGDISLRASTKAPEKSNAVALVTNSTGNINSISLAKKKESVDINRLKATPATERQISLEAAENRSLLSSPRPETNAGVSSESRRFVRGVLHNRPRAVWWGALITLLVQFSIPTGIASMVMLLLKDQKVSAFAWVPGWFIAFPISVFVFGLAYLLHSYNLTCRVCGQKFYVPRKCLKNNKAHHIPILGYILPLIMHLLLFRWFRCTYCGTAIRIKE